MAVACVLLCDSILGKVDFLGSDRQFHFKNESYDVGQSVYDVHTGRVADHTCDLQLKCRFLVITISGWFMHDEVPEPVMTVLVRELKSFEKIVFFVSVGMNDLRYAVDILSKKQKHIIN